MSKGSPIASIQPNNAVQYAPRCQNAFIQKLQPHSKQKSNSHHEKGVSGLWRRGTPLVNTGEERFRPVKEGCTHGSIWERSVSGQLWGKASHSQPQMRFCSTKVGRDLIAQTRLTAVMGRVPRCFCTTYKMLVPISYKICTTMYLYGRSWHRDSIT